MDFSDHNELARRPRRQRRRRSYASFWNFLTLCTLIATIALISGLILIFVNPFTSINPFPPPTLPALIVYPTATQTPVTMPPTWTPTVMITETPLAILSTATLEPEATQPDASPTNDVSLDDQNYSFALQGAPTPLESDVFKSGTGCAWQGVAGLVVDMQSKPLINIGIMLTGTYNGKTISTQTISGTHTEYGESGYEFQLGMEPIASAGLLSIQLVDQAGLPLSAPVVFDTYEACGKNLVLINFKQIK